MRQKYVAERVSGSFESNIIVKQTFLAEGFCKAPGYRRRTNLVIL